MTLRELLAVGFFKAVVVRSVQSGCLNENETDGQPQARPSKKRSRGRRRRAQEWQSKRGFFEPFGLAPASSVMLAHRRPALEYLERREMLSITATDDIINSSHAATLNTSANAGLLSLSPFPK